MCHIRSSHVDSLYSCENGMLLCRSDYQQLRRTCVVCQEMISQDRDFVVHVNHYRCVHVRCLVCHLCRSTLTCGDAYRLDANNRIVCYQCVSNSTPMTAVTAQQSQPMSVIAAAQQSSATSTGSANSGGGVGGGGRGKRGRKSRLI